jgi:hypothetical protein
MQRAFGTATILSGTKRDRVQEVKPQDPSASLGATLLRRRQRLIQPRLAAIRRIFMDDPALGGFIDSRD